MVGEASLNLPFIMPPHIMERNVPTGWLILGLSSQPFFRRLMQLMVGVGHHLSLLATQKVDPDELQTPLNLTPGNSGIDKVYAR